MKNYLKSQSIRKYQQVEAINGAQVRVNDEELVHLCSTSYLGLNWNEECQHDIKELLNSLPSQYFSSLGSNYLGGYHHSKVELEKLTALVTGKERALAFSSGWSANFSVCEYLGATHDIILSLKGNHNSMIEGLRKYKEKVLVIEADNVIEIEEIISRNNSKKIALVYTSIEGLTGKEHRLPAHINLIPVTIVSDESHSFGMIGEDGCQMIENNAADIRIVGFSKAFGNAGGVICASATVIEWLMQYASAWIFSTPLPPYVWEINRLLLEYSDKLGSIREELMEKASFVRSHLFGLGQICTGKFHITGLHLPPEVDADKFEKHFQLHGFYLKVSGYPSLPYNEKACRIVFNQYHSDYHIDRFLKTVNSAKGI